MSTLKELRLKAHLSRRKLGQLAGVDDYTVKRAEEGKPVQDAKAMAILDALVKELQTPLRLEDIDDLKIWKR